MIRMGFTLLLTSSCAVICRIADFALFGSVVVKVICLVALTCSFGLFVAALGAVEYRKHQRHQGVRDHSSHNVMQVAHAGARI